MSAADECDVITVDIPRAGIHTLVLTPEGVVYLDGARWPG